MTRTRPTPARRAVTLTGSGFHRIIRAVLPYTATDGVLPVLNTVHLEITCRGLYAAATDRYTVAVARHADTGPGRPHAHASIPRAAAAAMLRLVPRGPSPVTIRITANGSAALTTASGATYRAPAAGSARDLFPDWRKLFADLLARPLAAAGEPAHLNPAYLARVHTARDGTPSGLRTRLHDTGRGVPVLIVAAGDWFLAAVMGIRPPAGTATPDPTTAWATDLTPAAAAA